MISGIFKYGILDAMIVEIHIASVFHDKLPLMDKKPKVDRWWKLTDGTHIGQVLEMLNLAETPTILMVNGCQGNRDTVLADGDILKIFGVPSGG